MVGFTFPKLSIQFFWSSFRRVFLGYNHLSFKLGQSNLTQPNMWNFVMGLVERFPDLAKCTSVSTGLRRRWWSLSIDQASCLFLAFAMRCYFVLKCVDRSNYHDIFCFSINKGILDLWAPLHPQVLISNNPNIRDMLEIQVTSDVTCILKFEPI